MSLANVLAVAGARDSRSCSSATRNSSTSHPRGAIRRARTRRPSATSSASTRRCRPTAASSSRRPGGSTQLCEFTSEVFYEGRLEPEPRLARRASAGVAHRGRRRASAAARRARRATPTRVAEEAQAVRPSPVDALEGGTTGRTRQGDAAPVGRETSWSSPPTTPRSARSARLRGRRRGRGSGPWTSSRARRRPSSSTRWPPRARRTPRAGMDFLYS